MRSSSRAIIAALVAWRLAVELAAERLSAPADHSLVLGMGTGGRRGPVGSYPNEPPRSHGGRYGLRERYELPLNHVANPRDYLTSRWGAPAFCFVAGDDPAHPTVGPALTTTGSPGTIAGPWELADGTRLPLETYTGAECRANATPLDPAPGEDAVVVLISQLPAAPVAGPRFFSTLNGTTSQGVTLYLSASNQLQFYVRTSGGFGAASPVAGHVAPRGLSIAVGIYDRSADTATLWTPGGVSAAVAVADGTIDGGGVGVGADPSGSNKLGAGGAILGVAYFRGAGKAAEWAAGSYARCKELVSLVTGIEPRGNQALSKGRPVPARASAASWQDEDGRWWIASNAVMRAGDPVGGRIAATRSTVSYRNVNPADGATWLLNAPTIGPELVIDGNMEAAGVASWGNGGATLSKSAASPHGGAQALRVAYNATGYPYAYQNILTAGVRYRLRGYARGDGSTAPAIYHASWIWGGTSSTSWQYFDVSFVASTTSIGFYYFGASAGWVEFDDISCVASSNLLADADMEADGTASYTALNATLSKAGTPHGGARCLRVTSTGVSGSHAYQGGLTAGKTYHVTGWARSDGTAVPKVTNWDSVLWTGTTSTSWQAFDVTFVAAAIGRVTFAHYDAGALYVDFDDVHLEEAVQVTDDSANLATAKCEVWGPNVFDFNNTTGTVPRYMRQGASTGLTNLYGDGNCEAVGTAAWNPVNGATLTKEVGTPHGGTRCLRITGTGTANPGAAYTGTALTVGYRYRMQGWARSDGVAVPKLYDGGGTLVWTGTTSTSWQNFDFEYTTIASTMYFLAFNAGAGNYVEFDDVVCTAQKFALTMLGDIVSGAGVQIGFWDTTRGTFFSCGDVSDAYARTIANAHVPTTTEYLCIHVPAGCRLRWIAQDGQYHGHALNDCVATTPIPNWATGAGATRSPDSLTLPLTARQDRGRISCGVRPLGWSTMVRDTGAPNVITNTTGSNSFIFGYEPGRWCSFDDATLLYGPAAIPPTDGVRNRVDLEWGGAVQKITVDGSPIQAAYDGGHAIGAGYMLAAASAEMALDSVVFEEAA